MSRVDKVFEILGLEADEEFKLYSEGYVSYRITRGLQIQRKVKDWGVADFTLVELLASGLELVKMSQKTKLELLHEEMLNKEHDFSLYSLMCEDCYDDDYILQGDCGTREEMEFLKEKRAVEAEIRFLQKKYPDNEWDGYNNHWYLFYDERDKEIDNDCTACCRDGNFFFPTEETLQEMLDTITEERYKKYILEI